MEPLLALLHAIHPMSPSLTDHLNTILRYRELRKKQYLLKAGHISRDICYIEHGLLRCFYLRDDREVSSWFMKESDVIVSVPSFFHQTTSYESIHALEDTTLFCISYADLQYLYRTFPEFNFIGRVLTEKYYVLSEQRLYSLRMQKSSERYQHLRQHHPELIRRVPSKYLASYLGLREETISRLRGKW